MVNSTQFEFKLLQFLGLIAQELHEHNKTQKELLKVAKESNSKFDDEQFKLLEVLGETEEDNKIIQHELREINSPIDN